MIKFLLIAFLFIFIFFLSDFAQTNEQPNLFICKDIGDSVSKAIVISKEWRWLSDIDECTFEVESKTKSLYVSVKKYESLHKTKEEFSFDFDVLTLTELYPKSLKYLKRNQFWSEAKGYHKSSDSDHLVMLRYKKIKITIIGSDYKLLLKVKRLLQSVNFEKYSD